MPHKKQFISKKNSVTFQLVHRSLKDPLAVDETAPQRVLVPVSDKLTFSNEEKKNFTSEQRKEEQQKYGIFFDDEYDYLKHLKDCNTFETEWAKVDKNKHADKSKSNKEYGKINLPSSVFESNIQETVGLLNKATPELGIQLESYDPDVIAALDDDFDFDNPDNFLQDDFIELANKKELPERKQDFHTIGLYSNSETYFNREDKFNRLFCNDNMHNEETKSHFTAYSMSSSIIKRNDKLTLLDDKFEKTYADYSEEEVGSLNGDHIEGHVDTDSPLILGCLKENERLKHEDIDNMTYLMRDYVKITNPQCLVLDEDSKDHSLEKLTIDDKKKTWDCESILSTYSNIYNHPKLIIESSSKDLLIEINSKTGLPKDTLSGSTSKLTSENLIRLETAYSNAQKNQSYMATKSIQSVLSTLSSRPRNETSQEKKERKKAFKCYRKERRKERKNNIIAFKEEKKRQEKISVNEKQNIQGNRIL